MPMKKYSCEQIEKMIAELAFPEYRELQECRSTVDDCLAGQRTIKEKCKYLPANDWLNRQLSSPKYKGKIIPGFNG